MRSASSTISFPVSAGGGGALCGHHQRAHLLLRDGELVGGDDGDIRMRPREGGAAGRAAAAGALLALQGRGESPGRGGASPEAGRARDQPGLGRGTPRGRRRSGTARPPRPGPRRRPTPRARAGSAPARPRSLLVPGRGGAPARGGRVEQAQHLGDGGEHLRVDLLARAGSRRSRRSAQDRAGEARGAPRAPPRGTPGPRSRAVLAGRSARRSSRAGGHIEQDRAMG